MNKCKFKIYNPQIERTEWIDGEIIKLLEEDKTKSKKYIISTKYGNFYISNLNNIIEYNKLKLIKEYSFNSYSCAIIQYDEEEYKVKWFLLKNGLSHFESNINDKDLSEKIIEAYKELM